MHMPYAMLSALWKFPALLLQFGCWWSSTDTHAMLPKAGGLSTEGLLWVCSQAAQALLRLFLLIPDAPHTSEVIWPC